MSMRPIVKGSTSQSVVIRIVDATDGSPEQAVEHNTSGLNLWYRREGGSVVAITPVALAAANSAYASGGIEHLDDGYYRIDLPDAAVVTGSNGVLVGGNCTGMVIIGCYVPLLDFNLYSAVLGADAITNTTFATSAVNEIRDAIKAMVIETEGNITLGGSQSIILALLAGRTNGGAFSTSNNGAVRASFTYTGNDRTGVTLTPSA